MFEQWKMQDFAPGTGLDAGEANPSLADQNWLDVPVPGDAHSALLAAGRIADPFYDRNEDACAWMEEREWWFRTRFAAPETPLSEGDRLELRFAGLDTFATIWLDGMEIGASANMFREVVIDIGRWARPGEEHTLAIRFDPPPARVAGQIIPPWGGTERPRALMRKAQFGYGWDWGPRLPTIGIWRPVTLHHRHGAALRGVHFWTVRLDPASGSALVAVTLEMERLSRVAPLEAIIRLTPPAGSSGQPLERVVTPGPEATQITVYLEVDKAQLWWTHDLGTPTLYELEVVLRHEGVVLDQDRRRVGIRTIVLDQSPDPEEPGTRFFRFILNEVPRFARGANWIPADSFVGAIPPERYARLLTAARDANMTMLRVWGGGIYEHDAFYDQCDELGILVWQDFMFACAAYPDDDPVFVRNVEGEARDQVRRLRSHPSLALWCGNNECQWLWDRRYWSRPPGQPVPGARFYDQLLPAVVAELDGATPYWPGSPYGGSDDNSEEDGDRHNWEAWHGNFMRRFGEEPRSNQGPEGVSYRRYGEDHGRFISEFGLHAAPVASTLQQVIPADQWYHHSLAMDHHNKDNPKNKGDNLLLTVTGLPRDLDEYIDFSMIAQAEGLKFAVEHYRRRMPHCAGALVWQLNDCWPVLSWSVIDYYGVPKAGYYALRRAFAPVLASFKEAGAGMELWISNDSLEPLAERLAVCHASFDGGEIRREEVTVSVPPLTSVPVWRCNAVDLPGSADHYLWVSGETGRVAPNRHFFSPFKDLRRSLPEVEITATAVDAHEVRLELRAAAFATFVVVETATGAVVSDNFFDLYPGQTAIVTVRDPARPLAPEAVKVRWR